jgi:hypothetical protein
MRRQSGVDQYQRGDREHRGGNRLPDKNRQVALADRERAAELLLRERPRIIPTRTGARNVEEAAHQEADPPMK